MGVATYNRGSLLISRQHATYYPGGHNPNSADAPAQPRPADYGSKAAKRALKRACNVVRGSLAYGRTPPDLEMLTEIVQDIARVGRKTAAQAAAQALAEGGT